ncbi:MAG TPA: patatin-like phospholipase family protein [Bacteroidia bacterium]|jgi:patatin-like phospholipase/acyl hydrolase
MNNCIRILSIDGGGIRGILPGQVLVSLEKKLQERTNDPNTRLADHFDLIAGTSTGGILTCIYLSPDGEGRPRFTAQQAVDLYLQHGSDIFKADIRQKIVSLGGLSDEKYSAKAIETSLKEYFGETRLRELLRPCIITSYNITGRYAHFFRSHKAKADLSHDFYLRDVARATSAAPTYFEPALVRSLTDVSYPLVDGGVFANNPALCAYAEARQFFATQNPDNQSSNGKATIKEMFMVSIGTGLKNGMELPQYDYNQAKDWGLVGWARPILDIMMSGVSETVDYQLQQMFDAVGRSDHYFRIIPRILRASTDMDDASPKNLQFLKEDGIESAQENDDTLERIANFLVGNRTARVS